MKVAPEYLNQGPEGRSRLVHTSWAVAAGRAGFTLIEVLIASLLTSVLMTLIWSMLSLYSSYLTAGRQQSEDRQLLRSLLQLLQDDLQQTSLAGSGLQVKFAEDVLSESETGIEDAAEEQVLDLFAAPAEIMTDVDRVRIALGMPGGSFPPLRTSLLGSIDSLRLRREGTPAELDQLSAGQSIDLTSADAGSLEFGTSAGELNSGFSGLPGMNADGLDDAGTAGAMTIIPTGKKVVLWIFQPWIQAGSEQSYLPSGLCRIECDQLLLQAIAVEDPDARTAGVPDLEQLLQELFPQQLISAGPGAYESELPPASLLPVAMRPRVELIPEVISLELSYYDGNQWLDTWNSDGRRELPIAVKVRLLMCQSRDLESVRQAFGGGSGTSAPQTPADASSDGAERTSAEPEFPPLEWHEFIVPLQTIRGSSPLTLTSDAELLGYLDPGGLP